MIRRLLLAAVLAVGLSTPARADPVTAAIATALGGTAFASTVASAITRIIVGVALSALSRALQPKQSSKAPGIKTDYTSSGETMAQSFILGRYATGGNFVAPPMSHGKENRTLNYVIDLADMPIEGLTKVYIDGEAVNFNGAVSPNGWGPTADGRFAGRAWLKFHDGSQTAADPELLDRYGSDPERPWSADMILRGVPYVVLTFMYDREVFSGLPRVRFEAEGIPLYDPRLDTTVGGSGAHRWTDKATWAWTENPVVMVYNILRGIELPDGSVWGMRAAPADLPLSVWFAAMNACDEDVPLDGGGTEKRYRAGLEVKVDEEPLAVIEELMRACGGDVVEFGGYWHVSVGAPDLPTLSISDEDLIVSSPRDYEPFPGLAETYNAVHAVYPSPENGWDPTDAVPIYNATWEAEDGGRRLVADLQLDAVGFDTQVRRLMRELAEDNRRFRVHVVTLPPDALGLVPLGTLSWTSAHNGYTNKLFEVVRKVIDPETLLSTLLIRERDPSDYDIDPASDADVPTPPSRYITTPTIDGIDGWAMTAVAITDASGVSRRPAIKMMWDPDIVANGIAWLIRVKATGAEIESGTTQDLAAGQIIVSEGILRATEYEVRGRALSRKGALWTVWSTVVTPDVGFNLSDFEADLAGDLESLHDWIEGGLEDLPGSLTEIAEGLAAETEQRVANASALANEWRTTRDTVRDLTAQAVELAAADHLAREEIRRTLTASINGVSAAFSELISAQADGEFAAVLRLTSLEAETAELSAEITTIEQAIVDGDNALAQTIANLSVGAATQFDIAAIWHFDATAEGWAGSPSNPVWQMGGFLRPADGAGGYVISPAGMALDAARYSQLRLRVVRTGAPTWTGTLWWEAAGQGWAAGRSVSVPEPTWTDDVGLVTVTVPWTGTVDRVRLDLADNAVGNLIDIDWIAIGRPAPGASSADLTALQQAVTEADTALASDITQLDTRLTDAEGDVSGLSTAVGGLETRVTDTETGLEATGTALTALQSEVEDPATGLQALADAVDTLSTQVLDGDGSQVIQSEAIRALKSSLRQLTAQAIEGLSADQLARQQLREYTASAAQTLTTRIDATDSSVSVLSQSVTLLQAAVPDFASAVALQSLTARVDDNESGIEANATAITSINAALVGKASTSALSSLYTVVDNQGDSITANTSAITSLTATVNTKASTSALNALSTTVTSQGDSITALSDSVTSVSATVGNLSASGLLRATASVDQHGAQSRIGLMAAVDEEEGTNRTAALFLETSSSNESRVIVEADRFIVASGGGVEVAAPFVIDGGTVYIADARVRTLSLEEDALTVMDVSGSEVVTNNSSTETEMCSVTLPTKLVASKVIGNLTLLLNASSSSMPNNFAVRVYIAGVLRAQLTQAEMALEPGKRRFDVSFARGGVTGDPVVVRAAIVNAGGSGVIFSNIWALAAKR